LRFSASALSLPLFCKEPRHGYTEAFGQGTKVGFSRIRFQTDTLPAFEWISSRAKAILENRMKIEAHLQDQLRMGQKNVVFFCYQYLLDEHLLVLARFR
jgi:NurA-like 5'-3' nuclease